MARVATDADARRMAHAWNAIQDRVASRWPGEVAPARTERRTRETLRQADLTSYISDDGLAYFTCRFRADWSQLTIWVTPPGLTEADYDAVLRELFGFWFADCTKRGVRWCFGELPESAARRSLDWLNKASGFQKAEADLKGWLRWEEHDPARAAARLGGPAPVRR